MAEIYILSDHHFCHANILNFTDSEGNKIRNFSCLEEMHETIIERHNKIVRPEDHFFFGGDVTFKVDSTFNNIMSRLNGKKRLIVGNHDKLTNSGFMKWFDKVLLWRGFKEHGFVLSHMPLKKGHFRDGNHNAHGHTHQNIIDDPDYSNICCETRNYTPVHIEEIAAEVRKK
jgi:calcineurin-like phosphoesterase family protein